MPRPSKPTKAASPPKKSPAAKKAAPAKATPAKKAAPARASGAKKATPAKTAPSSKQAPVKKQATSKATTPAKATTAKASTTKATAAKATPTKASAAKTPAPAPAKAAPAKKQAPAAEAAAKAPAPSKPAAPAKPAPPKKSPFDAKFLEAQKVLLAEERDTYVSQAQALKAEADQLAAEMEPGDVQFDEESGEGGTANVDRERDLALSAQALQAVEEIDFALAKIKAGTYGLCESCGQPIMKARLQAIPHARLCVACKSGGLSRR
ncbi:MAG: TraR/DksA C4-type zinc finger protein [Actinobacteria bacterium]|nr:TraR/DksA C4-type zinc finger protein [Actinomycetota bacterium]MBV8958502.1 TraR/DksA C4-type zinc finger protein [Actinomycetota bacterium]MBV9255123.1 TraR/DksA C4-type zinc finger protein [Actinomycetota bacterium]